MIAARHLILQEMSLRPSGEWTPASGWTVVRVAEGAGYGLQTGTAKELNAGDMVVVGPNAAVTFRSSQLGVMKLEYFQVLPQCLNGLLTVTEWRHLEDASSEVTTRLQHFAAGDPAAQKFTRLATQPQRDSLAVRSALLQLWAASIAGLLPSASAASAANNLRERFRQFVGKMSEAELAVRPLTQLAGELHCSERHFSRLFREEFHVSLRERQTELRLQRARQLLAESDAKIINVAYESGYRHLGLFNAMFKRRFGVTPSQWRQQNHPAVPNSGKRPGLAAIFWLLVQFLLATGAVAQANSESNVHRTPPAAATSGTTTNTGPHFRVDKYLVTGNTMLTPEQIAGVLSNVPAAYGTNVDFDDIRTALANLQMAYRERGFVTVSVGLPQQRLTNAEVRIKVTEGRLTKVKVEGNNYFSTPNVLRALPSLHTNMLLNSHVFQQELDNANANRDRQIYPVIGPGPEPGTTELTLKVKDRYPLHVRSEYNDISTPGTPYTRVNFTALYENLWQLEHEVGVSYNFSPLDYRSPGDYYWWPLDQPLIANYSIFYRMPLGPQTSVQQQIEQSGGHFGYNEVTHQFQMPPPTGRPELTLYASRAVTDTGVQFSNFTNVLTTPLITINSFDSGENVTLNENIGAKFVWPLPQMGRLSATVFLGADFKHYAQASYNSNNFTATEEVTNNGVVTPITQTISTGQPTVRSEVSYVPINFGFNGTIPDSWGSTAFNAQANFNLGTFGGMTTAGVGTNYMVAHGGLSEVANGRTVRDKYLTVQLGADRQQRIYKDWNLKLHADGQLANGGLISNEEYAMGGVNGVRGYQDGAAYGDAGWRISVEPQTPLIEFGMVDGDVPMWLRSSVFVDYGQIYAMEKSSFAAVPGDPNMLSFLGTGWAVNVNIGSHLDGRFTVAFPLINALGIKDWSSVGNARFYFAIGGQF